MNSYAYSVLAFGFCSFLVGFFVWFRLRNETGAKYFGFTACAGIWGMVMGVSFINDVQYETALFCARVSNGFAGLIAPAWLLFCLSFVGNQKSKIWRILLIVTFSLATFVFINMFSSNFVPALRSILQFAYFSSPGWIYHVFTLNFFLGVILGFFLLIQHLLKLEGESRKSCLMLVLATGAGFAGGSLTFLPAYGINFPQYGMWIMPLYPIFMAVAMMRYDLFSVENFAVAAHKDKLAALGILTASINHEIRSPLFVMRGAIETGNNADQIKERVLPQIDRITGIVSRLTHFAKKGVEEEAKIEPLDLKEVLANIRPLFQHQLSYQHIEYTQDIPNDLPKVLADRRYLEEILFNLILNACQALRETQNPTIKLSAVSPQGSRRPSLGAGRQSSVGSPSAIVITIADNGPGMTPEALKNIFKPFNTTKQEGTGLGLYITKQLVEKCEGRIEAMPTPANGAQFRVSFKGV